MGLSAFLLMILVSNILGSRFRDTSRKSEEAEPMFMVMLKPMMLNAMMIFFSNSP